LHAYEADIGVLGEVPKTGDFEILKLNSTPIIAFASRDYPLAGQATVTFPELATHPLVMRERGSKTRQKLEAMAADCGVPLTPLIEAEGREAVREIVAAGGGVGFVSFAEFGQDNRLVPIRIDAPEMLMDEALICLRERANGKLVNAFYDIARRLAATPA
jgi:DNA-binding transcriptional LysR family regulator